ncbi:MAG: metalloregulator ArsR/SmtB family transcription factor [Halalkalicoccus sp.]
MHDGEESTTDATGCCRPAPRPSAGEIDADVRLLSTLANETRYEALRVLDASAEELCACEIEGALPVSQSAVSQALSALYAAELVDRQRRGGGATIARPIARER